MSSKRLFALGFSLILLVMSFLVTRAQDGGCEQGDVLFAAGNYAGAVSAYTCALQTRSDSAALFNARGNAYRHLENYAQAILDYNRAIELAPTVAIFYNNRGFAEFKQGSLAEAMTDFNQALGIDPNLAYAYNNRGLIYAQRGQNDLAAADFHKAIDLGHDPIGWPTLNLSNLHMEAVPVGDVPSIEVTAQPNSYSDGVAAYRAQDYDKALTIFTQLIEADPQYAYYCERAGVYYMLGDYQHAIDDYTKAIDLEHRGMHYTGRANSYLQLGEIDKALEDYTASIRVEPTYLNAYLYRSLLYHQRGDTDQSRADFAEWMKGNGSQFFAQPTPESGESVTLSMENYKFYSFKVPVKKGQVITIETTTASDSGVDPMLILVESGIPQAIDDDGGVGLNALINKFVVPGDCVYDLYLVHPGTVGSLDLTITIANP